MGMRIKETRLPFSHKSILVQVSSVPHTADVFVVGSPE
jgi:hypothetical protein